MSIQIKEFETMVADTLNRITGSSIITNINVGSVIRTLIEAILSEVDLQYYQIYQLYQSMNIDTATSNDLDRLIKILGIVRNSATKCTANIIFGRSSASVSDILIPINTIVGTRMDANGLVTEFVVSVDGAKLPAGDLTVSVQCTARIAKSIYLPANTVVVMNNPIIGIEYINNTTVISGGTNAETDSELRVRTKNSLALFGRGTSQAIEAAVKTINGITNAICADGETGGTATLVIVPTVVPASSAIQAQVLDVVATTKSAGVNVTIIYPSVLNVNISVNTTGFTDTNIIASGIMKYINTLSVGDSLIINQMERYILNECNSSSMDVTTVAPATNTTATESQIIHNGTITINGVEWSV